MKIKVTVDLSEEELRVLGEIVLYCGDPKDCRVIPVQKLYNQYKATGSTVSNLLSKYLIEPSGRYKILVGDVLSEHDVYPTSIGKDVVKAAGKRKPTPTR